MSGSLLIFVLVLWLGEHSSVRVWNCSRPLVHIPLDQWNIDLSPETWKTI